MTLLFSLVDFGYTLPRTGVQIHQASSLPSRICGLVFLVNGPWELKVKKYGLTTMMPDNPVVRHYFSWGGLGWAPFWNFWMIFLKKIMQINVFIEFIVYMPVHAY